MKSNEFEFWLGMNRRALNEVDRELGRLLGDRIRLSQHTRELKSQAGITTRDPTRERTCIQNAQDSCRQRDAATLAIIALVYKELFEAQE